MPYCKSCGAYIPDGLTACIACGFDENAPKASAAANAQTAKKTAANEDMREILERHRKLQQEKNQQWAESEKARREQQAENRRWAQEEYARRQAEREVQAEQREQEQARRQAAERRSQRAGTGTGNTGLAALSYLGILFALPFFLTPDDQYAKFHAKQGLRLFLLTLFTRVLKYVTPFGWIFTMIHLYLIYKGMSNALNGRKEPLPYIGTIGKN